MNKPTSQDGGADARSRLEEARWLYRQIYRALQMSLAKLEEDGESKEDSRARTELFRSHLKQLQSVFELEGSIEELGQGHFVTRLDLDAARDEVRQRLARIRERRTD